MKICELCSSIEVRYSIHFEIKCPVDNCTINSNKNRRNHIICQKCFDKNKDQIEFNEERANENIKKLKRIRNKHAKAFDNQIGNYL